MKGKTQFPQFPVGEGVGAGVGAGDGVGGGGVGATVDPDVLFHPPAKGAQVTRSGICWLSQSVK